MKRSKITMDALMNQSARLSQSLIPVAQLKTLKGGFIVEDELDGF